jgi:prepilin-type N-terminal cleavage/methylation domain-containing protein/prepilin-type processing-associated H-X9-DG protein
LENVIMKSACNTRNKQSGFTLIELLVVIAIIAILASILFPVFGRARENARRSSCMSNLKQIGLGMLQYTQDFDERFPAPRQSTPTSDPSYDTWGGETQNDNGTPARASWRQKIFPYVKSAQLFRCPSNTANEKVSDQGYDNVPAMPRSYLINRNIYASNQGTMNQGMPLATLTEAATKIAVAEGPTGASDYAGVSIKFSGWTPALFRERIYAGHLATANFLYCDGHVKSQRAAATANPVNQWGTANTGDSSSSCVQKGFTGVQAINCSDPEALTSNGMNAVDAANS